MKRQERRGLQRDGSLSNSSGTEEDRAESAKQPVAGRQVRRALVSAAEDQQLLLKQEVLRHHRFDTADAAKFRDRHGEVKQREKSVPHSRVSVGQMQRVEQRCRIRRLTRELSFRDAQGFLRPLGENSCRYFLVASCLC